MRSYFQTYEQIRSFLFTEFERVFHISMKFKFDMYHEKLIFQSHATSLKYDKILQKAFFFTSWYLYHPEIMGAIVDGKTVQ